MKQIEKECTDEKAIHALMIMMNQYIVLNNFSLILYYKNPKMITES